MEIDSIREILKNGESETVEAKSNPNDIASLEMTACAFANTKGGHIIIGVEERHNPPTERDRFRYDGIAAPRGLVRQLENIGKTFRPAIKVEVDQVRLGNNQAIFIVSVPKHNGTELVSLKSGVAYLRMGAATAKATDADIMLASSDQKISDEGNPQVHTLEKPDEGNLEEKVFVDISDEAAQLREKIIQEFENLTDELQLWHIHV